MKKSLKILTGTMLFLVLAISPIFLSGCFDKAMTVTQAATLVNKVVSDMNLQNTNYEPINTSPELSQEIVYENYIWDEVNYNGKYDFVKAFILMAKFAFEGDVKPQTYYESMGSYPLGAETYTNTMKMYFTLSKNVLKMWVYDVKNDMTCYLHLDNNPNDGSVWILSGRMDGTFSAQKGFAYFEIRANAEKIVGFGYGEIVTQKKSQFAASDVSSLLIYDCRLENNTILHVTNTIMNDDQIVEYASIISDTAQEAPIIDFALQQYKEIDFLQQLYIYLGYTLN